MEMDNGLFQVRNNLIRDIRELEEKERLNRCKKNSSEEEYFSCLECQQRHYKCDNHFELHVRFQSKEGIKFAFHVS